MLKNRSENATTGIQKTAYLYTAILINTALGFVATKLNTHYLNVDDFGRLNFFIITLTFSHHFFSFGIYESASRRIAVEKARQKISELSGVVLLFSLVSGLLYCLFVFIWSYFSDRFFEVAIGNLLSTYAPLAFTMIWQTMLLILLRGKGDISGLSFYTFLPRLFYVLGLSLLALTLSYTLESSILLFLVSIGFVSFYFILRLRPVFKHIKENLAVLREETRSFGRHLYVANLISTIIMHADKLFLAYFLDARQLAYYTLSFTLSVPLLHFATAVSRSHYHSFANSPHIGSTILKTNLFFQIAGVSALMVLGKPIIIYVFSADYLPGIEALYILAIAFGLSGLAMPFTSFLKAQGKGREIRNITFQVQAVLILLSLIFIPQWGINGAAAAVLAANGYDLAAYFILYKKVIKHKTI
ncbi:MAG TPA: hypothetical protein ENK44_12915 [Caldithrix abyssi]|uniref:Polysaccharide biosynthesis protein C-terminal domain-containing protein n=1 Tax=Caldithrix abyssi TaxID=187145 RepID=A0A7V4U2A7_CALAY|nr:hypothetical protein [Caldithrix abyssi]